MEIEILQENQFSNPKSSGSSGNSSRKITERSTTYILLSQFLIQYFSFVGTVGLRTFVGKTSGIQDVHSIPCSVGESKARFL